MDALRCAQGGWILRPAGHANRSREGFAVMQAVDLTHIQPRHDAINIRLEQWARWVRVAPQRWSCQPMFRGYQSKSRQWESEPHIHIAINTLEASETEKAVSFLPVPHRDVVRWAYVFFWVHPGVIQRRLGLTQPDIAQVLTDARDMLCNRLKEKMVDRENVY